MVQSNNPIDNFSIKDAISMIASIDDKTKRVEVVNNTFNFLVIKSKMGGGEQSLREDLNTFVFAIRSRFDDVDLPYDVVNIIIDRAYGEVEEEPIVEEKQTFNAKLIKHDFK